jgi:hypothetical protein
MTAKKSPAQRKLSRARGSIVSNDCLPSKKPKSTQPPRWTPPVEPHDLRRINYLGGHLGRVNNLIEALASIAKIEAEIARCVPLCKSCHAKEHERMRRAQQPRVNGRFNSRIAVAE